MEPQNHNPYAPPAAVILDDDLSVADGKFVPGGRRVPAGNGFSWIGTGWHYFRQSPLNWAALALIFGVLWIVISIIPGVNFLASVIFPIFTGGMMIACENQRRTGSLAIGDLFAGFQQKLGALAIVGLISLGVMLASMIPLIVVFGLSFAGAVLGGAHGVPSLGSISVSMVILGGLLVVVMSCVTWSLLWFAPALVTLQNQAPIEALKNSFIGCWRNPLAGLLYGIGAFIVLILGMIPLFLGLFVVMPMLVVSIHAGYRDIFLED
jgi:uncharacterized membrane protein